MAKIICPKCGNKISNKMKFCPNCGSLLENGIAEARQDELQEESINGASDMSASSAQPYNKTIEMVINIFRWIVIAFLVIMLIGILANRAWASAFFVVLAIAVITPLNKHIPIKIPRVFYAVASLVLFIVAFCFYPASDVNNDNKDTAVALAQEHDTESDNAVIKIDKKTQRKIEKIEKYIANAKYDKAYKNLSELDVEKNEKTRLYALYYSSMGDYAMAEKVLYDYCNKLEPLSDNEEDPLYSQLLEIYDRVPDKQEEIDLFKHSVYVSKVGYEEGHDWIDATCTTKKICKICGEETGEPLGHDWIDATCTNAKKCSRCGEQEGQPLGHDVDEWSLVRNPTCSEEGIESGLCLRCGEEVEQSVAKIEHTPGNWEITRETTSASVPGEKSLLCKICGATIETESYTISKEEELKIYKSSFESVSYEELSRYPDSYKGKKIKVRVTIVDEIEEGIILYTPYKAIMGGKDIAISDGRDVKEPKLLKGDTVTIYGVGDGTETIKTKRQGLLWDKTVDTTEVPMVKMLYAEF